MRKSVRRENFLERLIYLMSLSHLKDFIYKFIVLTFIMELRSKVDIFDTMNEVNSIYKMVRATSIECFTAS